MEVRHYAPNMEPDVVLACGCIETNAFALKHIGKPGEYQLCDTHPNGAGKYGSQKILREASIYERIAWREHGTPAPKRRSNKTPKWLRDVQEKPQSKARAQRGRNNGQQERLF